MDSKEFIACGIIESYCKGTASAEDAVLLQIMLKSYPQLQAEIIKCEKQLLKNLSEQSPGLTKIKYSLMRKIYKTQATLDPKYLPLMDEVCDFKKYAECFILNAVKPPSEDDFYNIHSVALPSTAEVFNIAIWLKNKLEEEIHFGMNEFVLILEGSCEMNFEGFKKQYAAGEIIWIPAGIKHSALVTSAEPMLGLVQKQLTAA